jgi:AraC family transcriptional regulator
VSTKPPLTIVDRATWIIERNAGASLSLPGIAEACGVSRAHLAHAFGAATGRPVMTYVRGRRLSRAAVALAEGARDILAVALDAGYGSHEAFTRAFRDQFGRTPEDVRARGTVDGLALVEPRDLRPVDRPALDPQRFATEGTLRVVGLAASCPYDTTITIPAQWQRFMERVHEIPARLDRIPVGVNQATNDEGGFLYLAAVEVARFERTPGGLTELEIPPRAYAVFEHRDHVSRIFDTYAAIWNDALPATGRALADGAILERHNDTFDPRTGEGGLTLWIPLEAPR